MNARPAITALRVHLWPRNVQLEPTEQALEVLQPTTALLVTLESSAKVMVKQLLVLNVNKDTIVKQHNQISSHSLAPLVADAQMVYRLHAHQAIINQTLFNQLVRHALMDITALQVV